MLKQARRLIYTGTVLGLFVAGGYSLQACGTDDDKAGTGSGTQTGTGTGTGTATGGKGGMGNLAFMATCDTSNDQCDGSKTPPQYCFNFNMKGPKCTHDCTSAGDCESPSTGCNGMGVCKAP